MTDAQQPIAIVGLGGAFPGAQSLDHFWENILAGRCLAGPPSPGRWPAPPDSLHDAARPGRADRVYSLNACELPPRAWTAADFAWMGPLAARVPLLDPVFALTFDTARRAFLDGGGDRLDPARVGVILANIVLPTTAMTGITEALIGGEWDRAAMGARASGARGTSSRPPGAAPPFDSLDRFAAAAPATLLARALGLGGPAFTLDAACASSLYALKLACDELREGRRDAMLAGGVSRPDPLFTQMGFSQLRALSASGVPRPFEARADGLVVGEGAGVFLLKRLADALGAGDRIHGVIRGVGLSNDRGGSLLAPDTEGQLRAMRAAYAAADWRPGDVDLFECHATGTLLGDATEFGSIRALRAEGGFMPGEDSGAASSSSARAPEPGLGSVKSNIGHLLTAAGAAGLMKTLFAMRAGVQPPTANFECPSPKLELAGSGLRILSEPREWDARPDRPRRAAVSAFGFGGINAHLLVEQWDPERADAVSSCGLIKTGEFLSVAFASAADPSSTPAFAIVGMDAHLGCAEPDAFQKLALAGTASRSSTGPASDREPAHGPGEIAEIRVAAGQFRIPPREMEEMEPQQALALLAALGAVTDAAGRSVVPTGGSDRLGVFFGATVDMNTTNYYLRWTAEARARRWAEALNGAGTEARMGAGADGGSVERGVNPDGDWIAARAEEIRDAAGPPLTANRTIGGLGSMIASRVARELRAGGPAYSISADERSGACALEVALRALARGELDVAIVGAVDLALDDRARAAFEALDGIGEPNPLEPANGAAPATIPTGATAAATEGAIAFAIKRLADAERDGDAILAVIRSAAQSTSPASAAREALRASGVAPGAIGRIELSCSHTGARAGALAAACAEAFAEAPPELSAKISHDFSPGSDAFAGAGSPAANRSPDEPPRARATLGLAEDAMGSAGAASALLAVARAVVALRTQVLPRGLARPEKALDASTRAALEAGGIGANASPQFWFHNRADGPRRALALTEAFDGSASAFVLEEHVRIPDSVSSDPRADNLPARPLGEPEMGVFIIAGADVDELRRGLAGLRGDLDSVAGAGAGNGGDNSGAFRLARARWARSPKNDPAQSASAQPAPGQPAPAPALALAIVSRTIDELNSALQLADRLLREQPDRRVDGLQGVFYSPEPLAGRGRVAFVFPGSGNAYPGMGAALSAEWPAVARKLSAERRRLRDQFAPDLAMAWGLDADPAAAEARLLGSHAALIHSHVSYSAFMSDVVRTFGVEPEAIIGYSLGETAGNFATRTWTASDEMMERTLAGDLFTTELVGECRAAREVWGLAPGQSVDWVVGRVNRAAADVEAALRGRERVYRLIVNAPDECVIGGQAAAVKELVRDLDAAFHSIGGVSTVHCEIAAARGEAYRALHVFPATPPIGVTFYSGAWGRAFTPSIETSADSILAQAVGGIDFPKTIEAAYADGARIFVEVGPRNSCSRMIGRILEGRPHFSRSACSAGQAPIATLLRLLAALIAERVPVDLSAFFELDGDGATVQSDAGAFAGGSATARAGDVVLRAHPRFGSPGAPPPLPARAVATFSPLADVAPPARPKSNGPESASVAASAVQNMESIKTITPSEMGTPIAEPALAARAEGSILREAMSGGTAGARASVSAREATAAAHGAYLAFSQTMLDAQARAIGAQMQIMERLCAGPATPDSVAFAPTPFARPTTAASGQEFFEIDASDVGRGFDPTSDRRADLQIDATRTPLKNFRASASVDREVFMDRAACLEFARGSIGRSLGPFFASIDAHPTRVRLPDEPLMFVDRILSVEGEGGRIGPGRVVTEHDVLPGAWYLDTDRMPMGFSIEAGQADLFLSAYLGIDFLTLGLAKYRLLDATVVYHRGLPRPGEVARYEISIERFIRQGETHLFFFRFDGFSGGEILMTMRGGCAGFFTDDKLAEGKGVILSEAQKRVKPGSLPPDWRWFASPSSNAPPAAGAYDDAALATLRAGDLAGAFGPEFAGLNVSEPVTIPGGRMKLIDRVTRFEPTGGRYGLGWVRAEIDIHPDDWFLTCHFVDDQVMPGTLMYESCLHALRVHLMRVGWVGESGRAAYEPVPGVSSKISCRGQVIASTRLAAYEVYIKEIGFNPEPYAIADAMMFADDRPVVWITNMSLRLTGSSREELERIWAGRGSGDVVSAEIHPARQVLSESDIKPAVVPRERIVEFTRGKPSLAFGEMYKPYDEGRYIARLPGEPFMFLDRITEIHAEPWAMKPGGWIEAQYDLPHDHWVFRANRQFVFPFVALLETALQPCGWYSSYMGSALHGPEGLRYRNLGGVATLHADPTPEAGTLTVRVDATEVSKSAGMIIHGFKFLMSRRGKTLYEGDTTFGFFAPQALANQLGVRGAKPYAPAPEELARARSFDFEMIHPFAPDDPQPGAVESRPALPARALRALDRVDLFIPDGGPRGLGFLRGSKRIDPDEWFFKAHFYMDPVCPGSYGLEGLLQLMKVAALERWGGAAREGESFGCIETGRPHTWIYRGQYTPAATRVEIDAMITSIDDAARVIRADGFLRVDGLTIYQMKDFGMRIVPVDSLGGAR